MKSKFSLGTRLSLTLSLAIASCLVANVVKAESHQTDRTSLAKLSQTIAKLIDLDPTQQDLVTSALHRATASKETGSVESRTNGTIIAPGSELRPIVNGKVRNSQPTPSPIINGKIRNPQPTSSPIINGLMLPKAK